MSARIDRFECRWQPSRLLPALHLLACALALAAILLAGIALLWQCAAILLLTLHLLHLWPQLAMGGRFAGLRCDAAGWHLLTEEGAWLAVTPQPGTLVLPQLVVLQLRGSDGRNYRQCVAADSLTAAQHRRLRLYLRWAHGPAPAQLPPGK